MVYESTEDALSAMWHYNETESKVVRGWFAVGTYPYADDIAALKEIPITTTLSSFLANNEVTPDTTGMFLTYKINGYVCTVTSKIKLQALLI